MKQQQQLAFAPNVEEEHEFHRQQPPVAPPSRLPPSAPPPAYPNVQYNMVNPPPYNFAHHIYDAIEPKSQHKSMFYLALLELFLGIIAWSLAITCVTYPSDQLYCPLYTGCWTTAFYVINGIVGIVAARRGSVNFFVAHIVLSVLCIVCSMILAAMSAINWMNAATDAFDVPCIVHKPQHHKLVHLNKERELGENFYANCSFSFKIGITLNMMLVMFAITLGILNIVSTILCFLRTCNCSNGRFRR